MVSRFTCTLFITHFSLFTPQFTVCWGRGAGDEGRDSLLKRDVSGFWFLLHPLSPHPLSPSHHFLSFPFTPHPSATKVRSFLPSALLPRDDLRSGAGECFAQLTDSYFDGSSLIGIIRHFTGLLRPDRKSRV